MPPIKDIQEKALSLFAKYGLKSVNMDDLAYHTGVSKKTLYQLFNSKEELVFSIFELIKEQWNEGVAVIIKGKNSPIYKILAFYQLRYEYIVRLNPAFLLKSGKQYDTIYHFMSEVRQQIKTQEQNLLQEADQLGYLRPMINIESLVSAHEILFDYFAEQFDPAASGSQELFRHLMFPAIAGIVDGEKYNVGKDLEELW